MHGWRAFILRCFGAKTGKGCHIYPKASIWAPWNLEIGDHASLADDVICSSMAKITIGKYAVISQGARLITGTHDHGDPSFRLVTRPVSVEERAWVAAEAFVLPGVTIRTGAVVGARSVVTRDVREWTVCAGNPCVPIKPRRISGKEMSA